MLDELSELAATLGGRDDLRALVLTGEGDRVFCGGADLKERLGYSEADVRRLLHKYRTGLRWLTQCPFPVVAALNGSALGGGLELAMLCDLRVSVSHARFGFPETSLGIIPGAGGTQRLPRLVGRGRALELIVLGARINATEALGCGLIHRITDVGKPVLQDTMDWLSPVLRGAPIATRAALKAVRQALELPLDAGLALELECYETCLVSQDRAEALQALAERRPPNFAGR